MSTVGRLRRAFPALTDKARHRWSVLSRVLAAAVGGYALTVLLTMAVSLVLSALGVALPEAVLATSTASFLVHAAIIMATFHARSAARAWAWLASASALSTMVTSLLLPGAGT